MAVVQIPIGGRMVGIDIPPLDINDMGQLLAYTVDQNNILSSIAGALGSQTQAINQLAGRLPPGGGSGGGGPGGGGNNRTTFSSGISTGLTAVSNAIGKGGAKISSTINELFSDLNMPQLGAGLGTIIGILEEFGNSMSIMNRIGAGVGQNFITLRNDAAEVGLSLGDLSKLSKESGVTVGALGKNTKEGVNRLLGFTKALKASTEAAGYYGMGAAELAQYMTDELEVRRQQGDANSLRTMNEIELAKAMNENLAAQQAMASLTGQDVRDRLKVQQDYRKDALARALMTTLTNEQSDALVKAQSSLSTLGSGASIISKAIERSLVGLPADMATQGAYQFAQQSGLDMRGFVDAAVAAIQSGNTSQVEALATAFSGQAKNTTFDRSQIQQLMVGNTAYSEGGLAIAGMGATAISTGATTTDEANKQILDSRATLDTAIADGSAAFLGLTNNLETATNNIKVAYSNVQLAAADIDITNITAAQQGFNELAKSMSDLPKNEFFQAMLSMLATASIVGSGTRGVLNLTRGYGSGGDSRMGAVSTGITAANDMAMLGLQAGTAAGLPDDNPAMIAARQLKSAIILSAGAETLLMSNKSIADKVLELQKNVNDSSTQLGRFSQSVGDAATYIAEALRVIRPN